MKNNFKLVLSFVFLGLIFLGNYNLTEAVTISGNTCTYKAEINTWSSCSSGTRYALLPGMVFATTTASSPTCVDAATVQACSQDIDGNDFGIINIGTQTWMADNLKTKRYNDGVNISRDGGVVGYGGSDANIYIYGGLYTYWVTNVAALCPTGWRMPIENDWAILKNSAGGDAGTWNGSGFVFTTAGGKLKTVARGGTNNFAFSALGGGKLDSDYAWNYGALGNSYWWVGNSAYTDGTNNARSMNDELNSTSFWIQYPRSKDARMSVRCIKDTPYVPPVVETTTCYDSSVATTPKPLPVIDMDQTGLVAYYPLNGNANDATGAHNPSSSGVTFSNSTLSSAMGSAAYFNGASDISIPDSDGLDFANGSFSNCLWYYKQEAGYPHQELVSKRYGGGYELQKNTEGQFQAGIFNYGGTGTPDPGNDKWVQTCYTQNNGTGNLYVNGEKVSTGTIANGGLITANPNPLVIGRDHYCSSDWRTNMYGCYLQNIGYSYYAAYEYFKGYMDDISFWSRPLSDCEVKSLYTGTNACLPDCNATVCYDPATSVVVPAIQTLGASTLSSNTYGYYPLTNLTNSGSTLYSNGTVNNATATTTGKFSGAYNLPGLNSNLDLGWSGTLLQTSGQKTFSLWVKPDGKQGVVFSKYKTDTVEGGYYLSITALNQLNAGIKSNTWSGANQGPVYVTPQSTALPSGQWAHVAVTIDTAAKFIKLYVNGDLVGSNTGLAGTFTNANAPFLIGSQWYGGNTYSYVSADLPAQTTNSICTYINCFYRGGVDDFFVVDKVLTDCEIKKLAKGPNACLPACTDCHDTIQTTNTVNVSGCQTLSSANTTYKLTQNLVVDNSSASTYNGITTCFPLTAKNVVLDCQGNSITNKSGSTVQTAISSYVPQLLNPTAAGYQIFPNPNSPLTLRNCTISGFTTGDIYGPGGMVSPNYDNSGSGGLNVDLFSSTIGSLNLNGQDAGLGGGYGGWGGNARLSNSTVNSISSIGGDANTGTEDSHTDYGGNGGNIYKDNSTIGSHTLSGGGFVVGNNSNGAYGVDGQVLSWPCGDPLTASCSVTPTTAATGTVITWTATSSSPTATYSWTGLGGLTGKTTRIATSSYSTDGTYYATTTVSNGTSSTTVGCTGNIGGSCTGACCNGSCTCIGANCNVIPALCGTNAKTFTSQTAYSGTFCSPGTTPETPAFPTVATSTSWTCFGSNDATTTDDTICHAYKTGAPPVLDPNLNCSSISPNRASPVNVNTNITYTANISQCPNCTKEWAITDSNNQTLDDSDYVAGNNPWDKIFTTIGLKTINLKLSSTTLGTYGTCSTTTTVVQTGGGTSEI